MELEIIKPAFTTRSVMFDWLAKIETELSKAERTELLRDIQTYLVSEFVRKNPVGKYQISLHWTQKIDKVQYFRLEAEISYTYIHGEASMDGRAATNSVPIPIVPVPPPPKIPKGIDIFNLKDPAVMEGLANTVNQGFTQPAANLLYIGLEAM
jgi:hypothetical protein